MRTVKTVKVTKTGKSAEPAKRKAPAKRAAVKPATVAATETFYKVLVDGRSFHGGSHEWSLPKDGQPGDWHAVGGPVSVCSTGFHLTNDPRRWWAPGAEAFVAEYSGAVSKREGEDKIAVERVRLLRQATDAELAKSGIFRSGHHVVKTGAVLASGSATVRAYGSATVEAYGSATVRAFDSATVEAFGSATVEAYGSATVRASGSATVRAFDSATVEAFGSATVEASGSATVEAFGSATVEAFGSATVEASGSATVEAFGSATVRAFDSATVRAFDSATVTADQDSVVTTLRYATPVVELRGRAVGIDRRPNGAPIVTVAAHASAQ